jgi:deoxyribonuclease V
MRIRNLHSWDLTPKEAVALQRELAGQVDAGTPLSRCELIAGADVSYGRFSKVFFAGVVVLRADDLNVVEKQEAVLESPFPYVPGLLSFREAPALLEAFAKVQSEPDVIMLDGHGFSHPRRFGLACHVGLCLDRACLGFAKTLFIGDYKEPGKRAGSMKPLMDKGEVIGQVVRTRTGVKPVFVSVGHKIDLASAVRVVLQTCRDYRLPEPNRQAHIHVNNLRREGLEISDSESPRSPAARG